MEVQPEWESALRDADKAVKDMAGDRTREEQLLNEANRRFEWLMNPQGSQWAAWATTAGFIWYLGLSPAAGLVNISQTAIVAFPELAARYGAGKALKALQKSMLETLQARRKWGTRGDYSTWQNLSADERKAFKRWHDDGVIDITQAQMLMGLAETDSSQYNPKVAKALEVTGSIFQEAEVINRQATLLAGYRLARDSHFDYSNANRARWMQSNLAKVLLLFRSYSQHMTYYLWRNVYQATKGESKAVRDEARKKVVGVLGMTGMFAGTMGLPLAGAVFGVANAVQALFGDDDEPWDADTEWRSFLADFGLAGAAVDRGVLNALTGADWSSRTSLNDMWFRTPDREMEGRDLYAYYLGQLAGPLGGIGESVFRAADLAGEGHIDRAMETATPKFMKAPLRAVRYATEGVTNKAGDAVVPDESLTPWDVVLQASGFTPDVARAQWDTNRARKNYEQDILRRRRDLIGGYALAVMQGDREAIQAGIKRIREYNKASPAMPISRQAIQQSLNARRRYRKESMAGINLNRRLRAELAETRVAQ